MRAVLAGLTLLATTSLASAADAPMPKFHQEPQSSIACKPIEFWTRNFFDPMHAKPIFNGVGPQGLIVIFVAHDMSVGVFAFLPDGKTACFLAASEDGNWDTEFLKNAFLGSGPRYPI